MVFTFGVGVNEGCFSQLLPDRHAAKTSPNPSDPLPKDGTHSLKSTTVMILWAPYELALTMTSSTALASFTSNVIGRKDQVVLSLCSRAYTCVIS